MKVGFDLVPAHYELLAEFGRGLWVPLFEEDRVAPCVGGGTVCHQYDASPGTDAAEAGAVVEGEANGVSGKMLAWTVHSPASSAAASKAEKGYSDPAAARGGRDVKRVLRDSAVLG